MSLTAATKSDVRERQLRYAPLNPYWWQVAHRVMPTGKRYEIMDSRRHFYMPYLYEPLCEWSKDAPRGYRQVWSKCGQVGCTEAGIGLGLWFLDECDEGVMYGLPTEDAIKSFVQARVDPSVRKSPYIEAAFRDTDNTDVKLAWGQAWYFRGAVSRSKLREIPVGLLVRDEYGEMPEEGRELMPARLGASRFKWVLDLGNPRYPESGIDLEYKRGDQSVWKVKCEACGAEEEPCWPESVKWSSQASSGAGQDGGDRAEGVYALVCPHCGERVERFNGRWVPTNPGAPYRSFRMSQLISPAVEPWEIAAAWGAAQGNTTRLQEFYNSVLGLPYAPEGARLTDEVLNALPRGPEMVMGWKKPTCMGVDVGAENHVEIRKMGGGILWAGTLDWTEMSRAMVNYNVAQCGIDIAPETTKAKEFARDHSGKVTLIRYNPSPTATGQSVKEEDGVSVLTVARTEVIDTAFARILNGEEEVPVNAPADWFAHMKAQTRIVVRDGRREYAKWDDQGKPDHYAHAFVYSELVRDEATAWERAGVFV